MTNGELIDMLIEHAKEFQQDPNWFERNKHMLIDRSSPTGEYMCLTRIDPAVVATVLVGFLNHVGSKHCMDLGLYLSDLRPVRV